MPEETIVSRPMPARPSNGLLAWQATMGYLSIQYNLDSSLCIEVRPGDLGAVLWSASAVWGQNKQQVSRRPTLPAALRDLWREIDRNHVIFESREALLRRPVNYSDNEWLDQDTQSLLDRTLEIASSVYGSDWHLTLTYQPVELPAVRFTANLNARRDTVTSSGQGAGMRQALHDLFRNAAPDFVARAVRNADSTD